MLSRLKAHPLRVAAALAVLGVAVAGWVYARSWHPRPADFPVQGVDVTADDGPINWWEARKDGVQFVYARATAGAGYRDPGFVEHWRGAAEAGLKRGAIHVYSLCQPAARQADNFVSTVARTEDQLAPAIDLDFESDCAARPTRGTVVAEIDRLATAIETHLGKPAVLRISPAFESHYAISGTNSRPLWATRFFFRPAYLVRPWAMWQASGMRRIRGANRPINWDVMAR
ncbi:GH25 family lysozyme [Sphingomonas sp. CJ20]